MRFLTGAHHPSWLFGTRRIEPHHADVPLFISHNRLKDVVTLLPAKTDWALDSGGFTILKDHGKWIITPEDYVTKVRDYRDKIGRLLWAAPQDWMCEPAVIEGGQWGREYFVGTHLSVEEHQRRTVENFLRLRELAPDLPFIPVVQGWTVADYLRCVDMYAEAGVDLATEALVGVGSVCRRQDTKEAAEIFLTLAQRGLTLHGFGVKAGGIERILQALAEVGLMNALASTDSMSGSDYWRRRPPLPGCTGHKNCANCLRAMLIWTEKLMAKIAEWERQFSQDPVQLAFGAMDGEAAA